MNTQIKLETVRHRLEAERKILQISIADMSRVLDEPDENLPDLIDVAEADSERQLQSTLLAQSQHHLEQVEAALHRLEAGKYGLCERCGQAIRPERLSVFPYATTCINCQAHQEQAGV